MRNEENIHHQIDLFLEGKLVGEDLDILKNRMKNDPSFAEEVALHKALRDEIMNQREAELKNLLTSKADVAYIKNMWSGTWMRASAAIFIAFIGIYAFLKLYNPVSEGNLAKSDSDKTEQVEQEPTPEKPIAKKTESEEKDEDLVQPESEKDKVEDEPASEAEESEDLEVAKEDQNKDLAKLKTLREEEDALSADDDVEVKKDQLLAERSMSIYTISQNVVINESTEQKATRSNSGVELSEVQTKKKRFFRKKEQASDEASDLESDKDELAEESAVPATPQYSETKAEEVKLQYWKNVVSFKGYSYSNNTLKVYGLDPTKAASIKRFEGNVYLIHDGTIYLIKPTSKTAPFALIKTPRLVKALLK